MWQRDTESEVDRERKREKWKVKVKLQVKQCLGAFILRLIQGVVFFCFFRKRNDDNLCVGVVENRE